MTPFLSAGRFEDVLHASAREEVENERNDDCMGRRIEAAARGRLREGMVGLSCSRSAKRTGCDI